MDMNFKNTEDYLNTQAQIVEKLKLIPPIEEKIKAAEAKLNSFGFKLLTFIGLGPDDFRSDRFNIDTVLPDLANTNLSASDLARKVSILKSLKDQLSAEVNGLEAELGELEDNAKLELEKQRKEQLSAKKQAFITAYEQAPLSFLAGVLASVPSDLKADSARLYVGADQIIAVSDKFNDKTQKQHLWQAWEIVAAARDLALKDKSPREADVYVAGAKVTFDALLKILPDEFKELEVLYRANKFDKIDNYLEQILLKDLINDQAKMQLMRKDIEDQKSIFSKKELDEIAAQRINKRKLFAKKQRI